MSRPTHFSCCVAEVDPPQRCAKTTADGLQSVAGDRQGCAFLKNVSQQASGWIMMGKLSFSLWPCFVIVPGVKIGKKYHLCMRLCVEFPLFSSWLVNGLLKWGWWHFGLMGTKVLYRTVKRLCLLFPKNQRQSPSEVSRYRGFIQYFAFLFVVWTSLVVTASCGVWGTSEGRH